MKLISLYIDNFGKLSDFSFDFSSKMNSIYEENGWGKTTLTVFIKSMLYGLNKNERQQYTPWKNLSSFGGCLVLEANGKEYRIERQFSPSKSSADVFKVYDLATNRLVDSFSPNLGEALLNLNEASFERSVFIPQKDLDQGFGSDIEGKLATLIGGTDDTQSFDQALKILKAKAQELQLNSKKGLIVDKKMELAQIEDELNECNNRMMGLPTLRNTIDQIDVDIKNLVEEKKKLNSRIVTFTKSQDKRAKLEVVNKYEQDIRYSKLQLEKNNEVFNGHVVSVEEVLSFRAKNKELQTLKTQYEVKLQNNRASQKVEKLEKEINITELPDDETIELITEKILKYNNIKSVIQSKKQLPKEKIKPKAGITFTILASILIIIGVALFMVGFFVGDKGTPFMISGIATSIIAILGYIGALAAFIVTNQKNSALEVGGQVAAYDYEKIHLEEEIREFFGKYHVYSSDFTANLFKVRTAIQRYKDAKDEASDIAMENKSLENKIKEYEESIVKFLGQFKSSPSCITYEEKIGELNTHLRNKKEIEEIIAEKERILKSFVSDNELSSVSEFSMNTEEFNSKIEEIDSKIESYNKAKATYLRKMSEYEKEISVYDDIIERKEECEAKIRQMEEELRLITLSLDYLIQSQTTLLEKYVNPMKDSVNKYVTLLLKDFSEYNIDGNFKFQFITNNGLKSIDSYSRGYQTLISLCMRLALIDCLYPTEKPFVILDDPFVNFDDEKLELCKALIRAISSKYQIMYFTCHKSREITASKVLKTTQKVEQEVKPQQPIRPVTLNPIPSDSKVRVAQPVQPKQEAPKVTVNSQGQLKVQLQPKQEAKPQQTPVRPQQVQPKRKTSDDVLVDEINKTQPEGKPQGVLIAKRTTADGGLGPMMSTRGQAPQNETKPTRTIKITKK